MRKKGEGTTQKKWRIQGSIGDRTKIPEGTMEPGSRQVQGQESAKHVGTIGHE